MKNHILWPPERPQKTRMCHVKVSFRAIWETCVGNAAEYFMFVKWKSKILVCLSIFFLQKFLGQK